MQHGGYNDRAHLAQIYAPLSRWPDCFFEYRDSNRDGLSEYYHGYDTGWDNSTEMLSGIPLQTADLDNFLSLQMDPRAEIAGTLGKDADKQKRRSITGEGLRDPAYAWTSSVYLTFTHQLLSDSNLRLAHSDGATRVKSTRQ